LSEQQLLPTPVNTTIVDNQKLPDVSVRFGGIIGFGYQFNINSSTYLTPEFSYRIPFSKVSTNTSFSSWEIPQLRLSLSLTFALTKEEPPKIEPPSELKVGFTEVRYYDNEGNHYPLKRIKVEDVRYTELFPLLSYAFCDKDSIKPSYKYQTYSISTGAGEFSIQDLESDALKINTRTIDIIGNRMKEYPNAELNITGTYDGKDETNKELPMQRAEFVKNYLVCSYNINSDLIHVKGTGIPEKSSTINVEDGIAENRRIEFSSSNPKILEPIIIQKENQTLAIPNLIEFIPYAISTDSIKNWQLTISQAGRQIRNFNGKGAPVPIKMIIVPNELTKSQIPVEYTFTAISAKNLIKDATGTIPIDYYSFTRKKSEELPDVSISKYSLILFDFDKSDVSSQDREIIEKYIVPAVKFNSTVKVYGYTDRIGDDAYNQKLAERRANAVKEILEQKVKTAKYEAHGVGEKILIFDNDSPVGRQLSRTVQIHIYTPK
jgi:outer membrane protein OmpA-like peptidoglycan-associated protein